MPSIRGYEIRWSVIALVLGVIALVVVPGLLVRSCDSRHNKAAQTAVEHAQSGAASNSAADAVTTVAGIGVNQAASEELTRQNEKEIRNAEGANQKVGSGVDLAGRRSLCKRAAYRDDPKCRMFQPPAR